MKTPGFVPGLGVDGKEKPYFPPNSKVAFQVGEAYGFGEVVGLASQDVIDMWLVNVTYSNIDKNVYPWPVLRIPHTLMKLCS